MPLFRYPLYLNVNDSIEINFKWCKLNSGPSKVAITLYNDDEVMEFLIPDEHEREMFLTVHNSKLEEIS